MIGHCVSGRGDRHNVVAVGVILTTRSSVAVLVEVCGLPGMAEMFCEHTSSGVGGLPTLGEHLQLERP